MGKLEILYVTNAGKNAKASFIELESVKVLMDERAPRTQC
jgi:hypothetical protein